MRPALFLIVLAAAPATAAPPVEDRAHRLDRMQTRLLNERAAARLRQDGATITDAAPSSPLPPGEEALRRRANEAIKRWRAERGCHPRCAGITPPPAAR